jgi:hypothetical protein
MWKEIQKIAFPGLSLGFPESQAKGYNIFIVASRKPSKEL